MLWSNYFIPTQKEKPIDAKIPSHQLMIRSGMIKQESAGIYSWLPIGLKVLKNIDLFELQMLQSSLAQIKIFGHHLLLFYSKNF